MFKKETTKLRFECFICRDTCRASLAETLQKSSEDQQDNLTDLSAGASEDDEETSLSSSQPRPLSPQRRKKKKNGHETIANGHQDDKGEAAVEEERNNNSADAVNGASDVKNNGESIVAVGATKSGGGSWEAYLGQPGDPTTNIVIRYPDGRRDAWRQSASSQLRALVLFVASQGFAPDQHELVTNFPRRVLSDLDLAGSLREHGLFPQETVFVQLRD